MSFKLNFLEFKYHTCFAACTEIPIAEVKLIQYFTGTSEKVVFVILLAVTV